MMHEKYMKMAIEKAKAGILKEQTPFGACIVKGGRVVACAHNAVWKNTDILAHAEMQAIRAACRKLKSVDLSGCVIYTTCEPCPMCFSACHWAKISKIFYGVHIADAKKLGFSELTISSKQMRRWGKSPLKIESDFMKCECLELFRLWVCQLKRKVY